MFDIHVQLSELQLEELLRYGHPALLCTGIGACRVPVNGVSTPPSPKQAIGGIRSFVRGY